MRIYRFIIFSLLIFVFSAQPLWAAAGKQPITVNGDTVEFKSEGREVVAEGNVEIVNQDTILTCDKVKVFLDEKIAVAEGHVRFARTNGESFQGETIVYDFSSQSGTIVYPEVRFAPYFGGAEIMEKISDSEFLLSNATISTCDLPHPHYTLKCAEIKMNPGNILTARGVKLSVLDVPLMYMPTLTQRLTDKRPRFMIIPGHNSTLGTYALGSWRYYLNDNARGLLHLNWYQDRGWAEGADLNYDTKLFGMGNAKYFRIDDLDNSKDNPVPVDLRERSERSSIELRHRWDRGDADHFILEYYRQSDATVRKDFFYREYEKVPNPKTFFLWSHVYPNATLSLDVEPRVNKFETILQRIPELKLETVNQKILETPFYYKSTSSMVELVNTAANAGVTAHVSRMDTANQLAYVFRFFDVDFNPFVGVRNTYYSRGIGKDEELRNMVFAGLDMSTKFFKIYDIKSDFLNLNLDKLRHVVTPGIQYRYQHKPTVIKELLQQFDGVDSLDRLDTVTFSLENKLQTKRNGEPVDLATLILSTDYAIERTGTTGVSFQNVKYKFELRPYKVWEFDSDAEYDTVGKFFKTINSDVWADIGQAKTTFGYRYKKGESSSLTTGLKVPLNPFWKLGIYERFEFRTWSLMEQEYTLDRDLHCWTMQFIINQRKSEGLSFLIAFTLKAFPDLGINAEKTFAPPRSGE